MNEALAGTHMWLSLAVRRKGSVNTTLLLFFNKDAAPLQSRLSRLEHRKSCMVAEMIIWFKLSVGTRQVESCVG